MRRKTPWWPIVLAVIALFLVPIGFASIALGPLRGSLVHRYFADAYRTTQLPASEVGEFPPEYHLADVPWLSTREAYGAANALRMAVGQTGRHLSVGEANFLLGSTYGASQNPSAAVFSPFTDPEPGLLFAAPYVGLKRELFTVDDEQVYLRAIRSQLSRGRAVRVALDQSILDGQPGVRPHDELLVGYDPTGFYYYETVCPSDETCDAGTRAAGERGLRLSDRQLLDAVESQSRWFQYDWRFALTVFEPDPTASPTLSAVLERNGAALTGGGGQNEPKTGANAVDDTAAALSAKNPRFDAPTLSRNLAAAAYARRDAAAYLRERFAGDPDAALAAESLSTAAAMYDRATSALATGIGDPAKGGETAGFLREAAAAERGAGYALTQQSRKVKQSGE